MSYTPNHLGHVNIYVRNAEVSQAWYEDVLGLHTYDFKPGRAAFMSANLEESHEVALMEVGENAEGPHAGQVGLNHMAWRMDSLDNLKDFYQRLTEKKIENRPLDHGISLGIYFKDPDGNGIEVYYEMPRSEWPSENNIFMGEDRLKGMFPGPWDEVMAQQAVASR